MTKARNVLLLGLQELKDKLDEYEQTTHGVVCEGVNVEVVQYLHTALLNPTSYTISSLSQVLDKFLMQELHNDR